MSRLSDQIGAFTTVPNSVIRLWPEIGIDGMALFLYLRFRTNVETEVAFPTYGTIQAETCLTRQRIAGAIRKLEAAKVLARKRRFGASTLYTLILPVVRQVDQCNAAISPGVALSSVQVSHTNKTDFNKKRVPSKSTPDAPASPSPLFLIATALAEVCRMDLAANRGRLFKEAKLLTAATPPATPELVQTHYNGNASAFWRVHDWRGRKGDLPTPANIRETWGRWEISLAPMVARTDEEIHAEYLRMNPHKARGQEAHQ